MQTKSNGTKKIRLSVKKKRQYFEPLLRACWKAYKAMTEGMEGIPVDSRDKDCAYMRVEAKRELQRVLREVQKDIKKEASGQ